MPGTQAHLTDDQLIEVRDGMCQDTDLLAHLETCDYCQAVLDAWRQFRNRLAASGPDASLTGPGDSLDDLESPKVFHLATAVPGASRDTLKIEMFTPPSPPAAWVEAARRRLSQPGDRHSLGTLSLYLTEDAALHMEADSATRFEADQAVYAIDDCQLHLTTRLAGFTTLLVARVSGPWETEGADEFDITLVSARGRIQTQSLIRDPSPAFGMAWFPVPGGECKLLIHMNETWELQVNTVFPPKV